MRGTWFGPGSPRIDAGYACSGRHDTPGVRVAENGRSALKWHTATRRLCAGTYLDRVFRERLLEEIYNARRRRVAPSYGYDLVQVLWHAWRAWWLETSRDLLAAALFLVSLVVAPLAALLLVGLLGSWRGLRTSLQAFAEAVRELWSGRSYDWLRVLGLRGKFASYGLLGAAVVVAGALLAMHRGSGVWPLRGTLLQSVVLLALYLLLFAGAGVIQQWQLDRLRDSAAVDRPVRGRRLRTVQKQQQAPFTVYSGYEPFVGSGLKVRPWSFAQRLVRRREPLHELTPGRDEEFREPPFTTSRLVEHVKAAIEDLAWSAKGETALPGLKVHDHIFVHGIYANRYREALVDPLPPDELSRLMAEPDELARYHIACQVVAWEGDLVTTVFVNVSLQGRVLYIEFTTYALTPTPTQFAVVDDVGGTGKRARLRAACRSLADLPEVLETPTRLAAAPKRLAQAFLARWDPIAEVSKSRDVGALVSARQIANELARHRARRRSEPDDNRIRRRKRDADRPHRHKGDDRDRSTDDPLERWLDSHRFWLGPEDTSYFQFLDVARHSKIIERRLLAAIEEFLIDHDVDTSEFSQRAAAILNNGIINTGSGTIDVQSSALGFQTTVGGATAG